MTKFGVTADKEKALSKKMKELEIYENDIIETFIKSSGPGGQNVNKVATCVQLNHRPTGLVVKVQKERSQALNRFFARRELVSRIEQKLLGKKSPEQVKIDKVRKQKKRRKRRSLKKL